MTATAPAQDRAGQRDPFPLRGRHALVTGGSRGIGAACARALAGAGADVTLLGRTAATLEALKDELERDLGVRAATVTADALDEAALREAVARAAAGLGGIDILVNNVGGTTSAPVEKVDAAVWHQALALNLTSTFACAQAVVPAMKAAGWGRIVNIASTAGLKGYAYVAPYCAAKHGVIGLTRALAVELARTGITVNAVCPGFADTDMTRDTVDNIRAKTGRDAQAARAELAALNPQGRLIDPGEVAAAVAYLCLPAAGSMTGQALAVAGGEVM
ncbi:MAG: SDR family oxidoreductase [Hyphomicrobiales bacterium]|nr:SDR family oxidoreductase [Hyphomicrobiales bacterium]MCP5372980.1 SDR family oxidoreductase [Hyphomicrobiales bacterium]